MEKETERTLRERLELLRLKDEQKRLNRLTSPMNQPNVSVPKNIQQPHSSQQSSFSQSFNTNYTPPRPYYISLGLGRIFFSEVEIGENPYSNSRIPNKVHSGYLFSAGLGLYTGTRLSFGYLFNLSKHRMTHPDIITQENRFSLYTHSALLKFALFPGRLKPFIGALVSFNQRTAWPEYTSAIIPVEANHYFSFYGGPSAGVDLFLGSRVGLSIIISYIMNVYRFQNQNEYERLNRPIVESNIEKMSRISTNASLKFLF